MEKGSFFVKPAFGFSWLHQYKGANFEKFSACRLNINQIAGNIDFMQNNFLKAEVQLEQATRQSNTNLKSTMKLQDYCVEYAQN